MTLLRLAWRNVIRNFERNFPLLFSIGLAVTLLNLLVGFSWGIQESLQVKARKYFGGDVVISSYANDSFPVVENSSEIAGVISRAPVNPVTVAQRSVYYRSDARLFFNGMSIAQRRVIGIDDQELPQILSDRELVRSGRPENWIIVSTRVAQILGLRVGDEVTLRANTDTGQANTIGLVVEGVFSEESFFGFASYVNRSALNTLLGRNPDHTSELAVYLPPRQQNDGPGILHRELAEHFSVLPLFTSQVLRDEELSATWIGRRYGITPLAAQLNSITLIISSINIISLGFIALFLVITSIGISNTYRQAIARRKTEIGIMRAVGMRKHQVGSLVWLEAIYISSGGWIVGVLGGQLLAGLVNLVVPRGEISLLKLFTYDGSLSYVLPIPWYAIVLGVTILAGGLGVAVPVLQALRITPVDAIRD